MLFEKERKNMDKVSIIIPVYNVKEYVDKCICSAVEQVYKDIEILIIDDGSNDGSSLKCDEWANKDKRIKVIHQKNMGVSVARNAGMDMASGKWVTFLDGDDYLSPFYVEEMAKVACEGEFQIIMCSYYYHTTKGVEPYFFFDGDKIFGLTDRELLIKTALGNDLPNNRKVTTGGPWMKMFRRDFLKNNNIRYVPGLKKTQDVIFVIESFSKAENVYYLNKPLYFYVSRMGSTVNSYHSDHNETVLQVMGLLKEFFDNNRWIIDADRILNSSILTLLLEAIKLKYLRSECNLSLIDKVKEIKELSENPLCAYTLSSNSYYKIKRKMLVLAFFLRHKLYFIAYLICELRYRVF